MRVFVGRNRDLRFTERLTAATRPNLVRFRYLPSGVPFSAQLLAQKGIFQATTRNMMLDDPFTKTICERNRAVASFGHIVRTFPVSDLKTVNGPSQISCCQIATKNSLFQSIYDDINLLRNRRCSAQLESLERA